jgi:hypothetical protein
MKRAKTEYVRPVAASCIRAPRVETVVRSCSRGRSERRPYDGKGRGHSQEWLCYKNLLADRFNLIGAFGPVGLEFVFVDLWIADNIGIADYEVIV